MGSFIEINDTLQITQEQWFPEELNLEQHLKDPYTLEQFEGKIFSFQNKPSIRIYQQPPVRNFLAENRNEKWIYWWMIHILSLEFDYVNKTTSGTYKIIKINTPEEMRQAFNIMDMRPEMNYFS
jgi:hypothetical protein